MLKLMETDNVIKNIMKEVVRECALKGVKVSESLAGFVIKLMVVHPDHGFISQQHRMLKREDVELLVSMCVAKLSETKSPALASIKMQVYFNSHYTQQRTLVEDHKEGVKSRTAPLLKEVLEMGGKTQDEALKLYRRLTVLLVVLSELGNPTQVPVFKEATAALHSVLPITELSSYVSMSRKAKELQIMELAQIVAGIRIFNRDCQKGGEGIDDLPDMLLRTALSTHEALENNLKKLMRKINVLTAAVDILIRVKTQGVAALATSTSDSMWDTGDTPSILPTDRLSTVQVTLKAKSTEQSVVDNPYKIKPEDEALVKDSLATARHLEVFIRKLIAEVDLAKESLDKVLENLQDNLAQLHATVRHRTAIPTEQVYPKFIRLSAVWHELQNVSVVLIFLNKMAWSLQSFSMVTEHVSSTVLRKLVSDAKILSDEDRLAATTGLFLDPKKMKCKLISQSQLSDFQNIHLQYQGFCGWALVVGRGALLPGNPNMGVGVWKDKNYAFSSVEAATEWGADPDRYVRDAIKLVRTKPELIGLLQLQEEMDLIKATGELPEHGPGVHVECRDIEVQTDLHPVPKHIDPEYTWNEWELRRRSIKLANLAKCKTTSMQTKLSNFRASVAVQAAPDKSQSSQTKRDNATNVPTLQNFIYGLRGQTDMQKCHVISLTQPVADIAITQEDKCDETGQGSTSETEEGCSNSTQLQENSTD